MPIKTISGDNRLLGKGRDTDDELTIDPRSKEAIPPGDNHLPAPLLLRASGIVSLPDWDIEGHIIKDQIIALMQQLSNRPLDDGTSSEQYIVLESQILPENGTVPGHQYIRRGGVTRWSVDALRDLMLTHQGSTVRELTLKMFKDNGPPQILEPRVRALLHRIKHLGWGEPRFDERGIQRWYAVDPRGLPAHWTARSKTIGYKLASLLGGQPREYERLVDALTDLMDEQGERIVDPNAWINKQERPY